MRPKKHSAIRFVCVLLFILAAFPVFAEDPSVPAIDAESKVGILREMRVAPATLKVGSRSFDWNLNRTRFFDLEGHSLNWERFRKRFRGQGVMVFFEGQGMAIEVRGVLY